MNSLGYIITTSLIILFFFETKAQKKSPVLIVSQKLHNNAVIAEPQYKLGKKDNYLTIPVLPNEVDEWLEKYNSSEKTNFVIYKKLGTNLLLIPQNLVSYYEKHEALLKREEEAKQEKIDNEEIILMNKIAEKPDDLELWKLYLDKFSNPKGKLYDKNIEYGEYVFFEEFLKGSPNALKTYLTYFRRSIKYPILSNYYELNESWEKATEITDVNNLDFLYSFWDNEELTLNSEFVKQKSQLEQFIINLNNWRVSMLKPNELHIRDSVKVAVVDQVHTNFLKKAEIIIDYDNKKILSNKRLENKYQDLTIGESRCILKAFKKTTVIDGKKYTPTVVDLKISVSILNINANTSEIQLRFDDVYNLTEGGEERYFQLPLNNRITVAKNSTLWVHPSDLNLNMCTADKFKKR